MILDRYGIDAHPDDDLGTLGPATQTMVAIARALHLQGDEPGILVLDEPTASLPASEVTVLLKALRRYAEQGVAIVFVTHRLEEVMEVADTITVLRDGEVVSTIKRSEVDHDGLVELILGRKLDTLAPITAKTEGAKKCCDALRAHWRSSARCLVGGAPRGDRRTRRTHRVRPQLRPAHGLRHAPAHRWQGGLRREKRQVRQPPGRNERRHRPVPEDRPREAAFSELSVSENMSMAVLPSYFRSGVLRRRKELADSQRLASDFWSSPPAPRVPCPLSREATSRRSCWRAGCAATLTSCCSTSRPKGGRRSTLRDLAPHPPTRGPRHGRPRRVVGLRGAGRSV